AHLDDPETQLPGDVLRRLAWGLAGGVAAALAGGALLCAALARARGGWRQAASDIARARTDTPWRADWITYALQCVALCVLHGLGSGYDAFGTDSTSNDVLWQARKSVRTALVIGRLTSLDMLPQAIGFGIAAGYFKGKVDHTIQFLYTTLTSIP